MCSEHAYVMAAERIAKIEVPRRADYLRVLVAELQGFQRADDFIHVTTYI